MSARAGAEKPEQPLRLSCSRFGFLDRELRERQNTQPTFTPPLLHLINSKTLNVPSLFAGLV